MQLTIDVNDSVVSKILHFLESLQSDVRIISQKSSDFDEVSQEELEILKKISDEYKSGKREEFEEYKL